ncbi:MAG: ATP-dependent helicase, partial [Dehalococcoidia bacterium]
LHKDLFTDNEAGQPVVVHEAYNEQEEAEFVISEIDRLVHQDGVRPGDCAVMYRVNAQSRALEEACLHQGTKYRLVGGVRFYQRREVKDLMAYLHLINNPLDEVNLGRVVNVPARGIGAKSMQDLVRWSQSQGITLYDAMQQIAIARFNGEHCPAPLQTRAFTAIASFAGTISNLVELSQQVKVVDLIDRVLEDTGLRRHIQGGDDRPEERWENILELRETAQEFNAEEPGDGLGTLLERLSLVADVDSYEDSEDSITLITLHQAKGLEFPVVFIVGLEEGLLPHSRSMDSAAQLEEERRLCYVGVTRAEQRLYLLRAFRRGLMGSSGPTLASRFLRDLPSELLGSARIPAPQTRKPAVLTDWAATVPSPSAPPRLIFQIGDLVRHQTFGEGVVMSCDPSAGDYEVTIEFSNGVGVKRLLLSYAPLEKVEG